MKAFFVILISLTPLLSFAESAELIGYVHGTYTLIKEWNFEKVTHDIEVVCQGEIQVPVFDVRPSPYLKIEAAAVDCPTVWGESPFTFGIETAVILQDKKWSGWGTETTGLLGLLSYPSAQRDNAKKMGVQDPIVGVQQVGGTKDNVKLLSELRPSKDGRTCDSQGCRQLPYVFRLKLTADYSAKQ